MSGGCCWRRRLQHNDGAGALGAAAEGTSGGQPAVCSGLLACTQPQSFLPGLGPFHNRQPLGQGAAICNPVVIGNLLTSLNRVPCFIISFYHHLGPSPLTFVAGKCWLHAGVNLSPLSPFSATPEGVLSLLQILGTTDETPSFVYAELDYAEIETRRRNMPITQQKRYDMYSLVDKT